MVAIALDVHMLMDDPFVEVIKHFEGFFPKVYKCPAGKWTIGYGHLTSSHHAPVTEKEAEQLLKEDLVEAYFDLKRNAPFMVEDEDIEPCKAMALISWIFNLGVGNFRSSTLLKRLKARKWDEAAQEILRWDKCTNPATGKKETLRGLTRRRKSESHYFQTGEAKVFD